MAIRFVKLDSSVKRSALLAIGLICLLGVYFFAKWCLANAISTRAEIREVADLAISLAPADPQTHYAAAVLLEKSFLPEDLPRSVTEYEKATALAPHNYLLWLALGRARERAGDAEGAEKSLRQALALAPNYAQVRWSLGNVLLRRGKTSEAFAEMRRAASDDAKYANPTISIAWQIFGGDRTQIEQALGDGPEVGAALAVFLAKQKRFEDAFEVWNALPSDVQRTTAKQSGAELYEQFIAAKKYRAALQISSRINDEMNETVVGKITNGGFETDIKMQSAGIFEWQISAGLQPQIALNDQQKRGGNRSLWIAFNSDDGQDFRPISQTVVVEAGKVYVFEAFYKSELKTAATLRWEITDAADGKVLAATDVAAANADWSSLKAKFAAAPATEAVVVRLARETCRASLCPIAGRIWFDDFGLTAID